MIALAPDAVGTIQVVARSAKEIEARFEGPITERIAALNDTQREGCVRVTMSLRAPGAMRIRTISFDVSVQLLMQRAKPRVLLAVFAACLRALRGQPYLND